MRKLISCIFKVLSNDLRGQQLLDTSLWRLNSAICWCFKSHPEHIISYKEQKTQFWRLPAAEGASRPFQAAGCNVYSSSHWLLLHRLEADRGGWLDLWLVFSVWCEWKGGRGGSEETVLGMELFWCKPFPCVWFASTGVGGLRFPNLYWHLGYCVGDSVWGLRNCYSKMQLC